MLRTSLHVAHHLGLPPFDGHPLNYSIREWKIYEAFLEEMNGESSNEWVHSETEVPLYSQLSPQPFSRNPYGQ